jgi:hypothetical protein
VGGGDGKSLESPPGFAVPPGATMARVTATNVAADVTWTLTIS